MSPRMRTNCGAKGSAVTSAVFATRPGTDVEDGDVTGAPGPARGDASPSHPPDQVVGGRYHLRAQVGSGQASVVYLADDLHIPGRQVAVKIAGADRPGDGQRRHDHLLHEAQALGPLRHGAIPQLVDVVMHDQRLTLVLEYVAGRTLRDLGRSQPAGEADALEWGLRLCDVLIYLHGRRQPLTHGAVRAEHCMLLPTGRLILFDFGAAAAATAAACQADTRAVALLLYQVLTNNRHKQGPYPALGASRPDVSETTAAALGATLHRSADQGPLTLGTLRRLLLECRWGIGAQSSICPYCQATTRVGARHCAACGSPLAREAPTKSQSTVVPAPLPLIQAATEPMKEAVAPPAALPVEPPAGAKGPSLSYIQRLRAVGHYIDQHGLRHVIIREEEDGFSIQGQGLDTAIGGVQLSSAQLATLARHARQLRSQGTESPFVHQAAGPGASPLFPTGYEDGLRALGYQLDMRGVRTLAIQEQETALNMEYVLLDDMPPGSASVQRLSLSATDMEAILASGIDRRGGARSPG